MKTTLFAILILGLNWGLSFSQTTPKFNLTKEGVKPVVLTFDASVSINQIYTKAKSWNANLIKFPTSAIRVDKENVQVKHSGHVVQGWKIRANNYDHWYTLEYTLNIEIKEGRCRVTFETPEDRYKVWYNANGTTIPKFKDSEATFEKTINDLLTSLYTHIKSVPKKVEDNW